MPALALALVPAVLPAQSVRGRVVDARSDAPIPGATVALLDATDAVVRETRTGPEGRFALEEAPRGTFRLRVHALGYTAPAGHEVELDVGPVLLRVLVEPAPLPTDGITVRVERGGSHLRDRPQMITGKVLDARDDDPVPAMSVVLRDVRGEPVDRGLTDPDGRFFFQVDDSGLYRLAVARFGYDSTATANVAVSPGQNLYLELRVQPKAFGLEPITVTAPRVLPYLEASGFYDRMKRGHGTFLGPRDLNRMPGAFPTQLLRRIPGVSVTARGGVHMRGITSAFGGSCSPTVYLDGTELRGASIDDIVPASWIDGIEVYKGASTVPSRWRGHATCGVIAIWTKH
ncbi:MAG: TonB-dependent receptor plug domain-containing protein [Gemmatimonadetes bacterium]|nr:TonB-dependent receptor plug domain-containing protein [Gemmatimonadota bacterium]NIQ55143.1 TonB-dependent receptor plug domain-containing protein [Gemmatimonadota bacterium]NIX45117.1 TonB-dependent receptor plug domain-containing protein [Gemmatimonadota bacterium]NIY09368.1 TonB-dependent receptor plug domain-containing protein [Gemmatimonadota bacterium]